MIELDGVTKRHGGTLAVDHLTLTAPTGQVTVLLGPSGCGKSSTLRLINRLDDPDAGTIRLNNDPIAALDPVSLRRRIGYAIQDVGLFPHWSVAKNIAAVPRLLGWPAARIRARVIELLRLFDLPPEEFADKRPAQLSGGQAQRVGVARAMAADPDLLLMDEPFGALDPITRRDVQAQFRAIQRRTGKTVVLVTHDIDEALLLGDRIALLRAGRLAQCGTPLDLIEHPADAFVRDFFGGAATGLRRLSLLPARARAVPRIARDPAPGPVPALGADASLRDALDAMLAAGVDRIDIGEDSMVTLASLLS